MAAVRRGTERLVMIIAAASTVCYGCGASLLEASLNRMCKVSMYQYIATLRTLNPNHNPFGSHHVGTKRRKFAARSATRV